MMNRKSLAVLMVATVTAPLMTLPAGAQEQGSGAGTASTQPANGNETLQTVVVTGTLIVGSKITGVVPVSVVSPKQIAAIGAVSGDDLIRALPQMGDVNFNSTNGAVSSNFARGDVGSINLRNLGDGDTLVLLNGRRVVQYPGTQASTLTPVPDVTYNTNAIPVANAQRIDLLLDGAAALYGADAVAGVVNVITKHDLDGGDFNVQYGGAEGTSLRELNINGDFGRDFADGRGNVTIFLSHDDRSTLNSTDQSFTSTANKIPLFAGTAFAGDSSLDLRSTLSSWGNFQTPPSFGTVKQGTTALTTASGTFHIQPSSDGSCAAQLGGGICLGRGNNATSGAERNTRSDDQAEYPISVMPSLERYNFMLTGHYDLSSDVTAYTEMGYYTSSTRSLQAAVFSIGSIKMTIPASNYWNPFGPVSFADGTPNPNRLPGLNIPASGLPVTLNSYRFEDLGPTTVSDQGFQRRILFGLRGRKFGFNWDTGILFSDAGNTDTQDGISSTALQQSLALSTPDAYDPFSGGNPTNPTGPDTTPSNQAALNAIRIRTVLKDYNTLSLWDFKVSRPDLFHLPGGDLGIASGVEVRRESMEDKRDPRVNGTITWTDTVIGVVQPSDLYGVSPTPNTYGSRVVESAYAELAVPVISPKMHIPLVRNFEMQLAGREEHYSDFGSVFTPKVAAAWDVVKGLRFRGSWTKGFSAPNLLQENATLVTRGNTNVDYVRCEADLRAGRITNFSQCSENFVATSERYGNTGLKPETSMSKSVGVVFQPQFIPERLGAFVFTADYWEIDQKGIVGVLGSQDALILDYLLRENGSSNPNVVRAAPTADDVAEFAGTGLAPAGQVTYVKDQYVNLLPLEAKGLDLSANWAIPETRIGNFDLSVNVSNMRQLYLQASPVVAELLAARAAGQINLGTTITGGGSLLQDEGAPKYKGTAALTWHYRQWTIGTFAQYIGNVYDTGLVDSKTGQPYVVPWEITGNIYGQFQFNNHILGETRLRIGVRNFTNETPPVYDSSYGYLSSLYEPYGRYLYASIGDTF
jgi:iron complex outermembrane receptor protein